MPHPKSTSNDTHRWTPTTGLRRATVWGGLATCAWIAILAVPAWYVPTVLMDWLIRLALAFAITWSLFGVVHRAAGMAGTSCTAIVVACTAIVLFSQHLVFAMHGVTTQQGEVSGWAWCTPETLLLINGIPVIGVAFAVILCHEGGAVLRTVVDILSMRVRG